MQADLLTNILACASNFPASSFAAARDQAERFISKTEGQVERTYEFYFNQSQLLMRQQLYLEAFRTLLKSYDLAKLDEDQLHSEQPRFKVQELHALNTFAFEFSSISYNLGGPATGSRFRLPKTLKHDSLVEVNMSALVQEQGYDQIDREHFKDLIGNLNWNKFAERIANQLSTNQNLTSEQRKVLELNWIVALIRSNQFDQAKKEWEKQYKAEASPTLLGIGAFFALR